MTQENLSVQGKRKEFVGTVVSDKMQKTIVVEITRLVRDTQYGKTTKRKAKFKVHDEKNTAHCGDRVRIEETRPMSKDKRWRLIEIISSAEYPAAYHGDEGVGNEVKNKRPNNTLRQAAGSFISKAKPPEGANDL